jgi:uncharacterized repeat protein (TIGR03803 family)
MFFAYRFRFSKAIGVTALVAFQMVILTSSNVRAQSESIIHSFGTGSAGAGCAGSQDGVDPQGSLTFANGLLFGRTTSSKTPLGDGIIFHMMPDGSGYTIDHVFTGKPGDGNDPRNSSMTLVGSVLYGTTKTGGAKNNGTIFSINDDGTGYSSPIYSFDKSVADNNGDQPLSCFESGNGLLYGMTSLGGKFGGTTGNGTIFSFDPGSATYTRLHSFGGTTLGFDPEGQPTLDPNGTTLYGMTRGGGGQNVGTIFSFDTVNGFIKLHNFSCPKNNPPNCSSGVNGATPDHGNLVLSGGVLYGMTANGGQFGSGIVFAMNTDGSNFKILRSFGNPNTKDGKNPFGSLILSGTTLDGMTRNGGKKGQGAVFQIDASGGSYVRLYDFKGKPDGGKPNDNVILVNNVLYGMTEAGGKCGKGAVFAIQLP